MKTVLGFLVSALKAILEVIWPGVAADLKKPPTEEDSKPNPELDAQMEDAIDDFEKQFRTPRR